MARIIITLEDQADGSVRIGAHPNPQRTIDLDRPDAGMSAAEGYALHVLNYAKKGDWARGRRRDRATVTITVEDRELGGVKVVSNPSTETLSKRMRIVGLTSAESCAMFALLSVLEQERKQQRAVSKIILPSRRG